MVYLEKAKIHRVRNEALYKRWKIIPYDELQQVLHEEGKAFVEDINRKTAWGAASRLSTRMRKSVKAQAAILEVNGGKVEGYFFKVFQS